MLKRTLKRLYAEAKRRNEQLLEQRDEAREDARAAIYAAKRTAEHNTALREEIDQLRKQLAAEKPDSDFARNLQLERRLARLQQGAGRWMAAAWEARGESKVARAEARRARREAEDIRRPYEQRLADLQAANEFRDWGRSA